MKTVAASRSTTRTPNLLPPQERVGWDEQAPSLSPGLADKERASVPEEGVACRNPFPHDMVMPKGIVTHTQRVYLPRSTNRAWRGCRAQRRRSANAPIRRCQASQTVKHLLPTAAREFLERSDLHSHHQEVGPDLAASVLFFRSERRWMSSCSERISSRATW